MKDFKFFNKNQELEFTSNFFTFPPQTLHPQTFNDVEFCFQFDDNEPVPFANGTNEISIRVDGTSEGIITFTDNNKNFTIFARERQ
jgi:hypothetical protein